MKLLMYMSWRRFSLLLLVLEELLDDEDGDQDFEGDGGQVPEEFLVGEVLEEEKDPRRADEGEVKADVS